MLKAEGVTFLRDSQLTSRWRLDVVQVRGKRASCDLWWESAHSLGCGAMVLKAARISAAPFLVHVS
jgi:hypothetical protein